VETVNRLTYDEQPEIRTFTSPEGKTHRIRVWMPIGERNPPVMVLVAPERENRKRKRRPSKNSGYVYRRIVEFIRQTGRGCNTIEIRAAIGRSMPIDELLRSHPSVFYPEEKRKRIAVLEKDGQVRKKSMFLWHVFESFKGEK